MALQQRLVRLARLRGRQLHGARLRQRRARHQGSTGETQLDSRRYEINDFQYLAGQIADDPFFNVNPQKVVATGGSYGGGFAWMALTDPMWKSPGGNDMKLAAVGAAVRLDRPRRTR